MPQRAQQLELIRTWGGRRAGAGRKPSVGRRATPHRRRGPHNPRCPVHVTLRVCDGMPSLRADAMFSAVRGAFGRASRKAINRALRRRGRVWIGCYHAHTLKTPREVRNALIYVLQNFKKHIRGATGLD